MCAALAGALGCAEIAGLDGYSVGEPPPQVCGALLAPNGDGKCVAVGVPQDQCGAGFDWDEGGCRANLPAADCRTEPDQPKWAVPGRPNCDAPYLCPDPWPIRGSGAWVYARPDGLADADGTQEKPYPTIAAALAAARDQNADHVGLGTGTFEENVEISIPLQLIGNCAQLTVIRAADPERPALTFLAGASAPPGKLARWVQNLAIEGGRIGISVQADQALIGSVWVHDVAEAGIDVEDVEHTVITNVLVERAGRAGIVVRGSDAAIDTTVVRNIGTGASSMFLPPEGISVHPSRFADTPNGWSPSESPRSQVTLTDSLVEGVDDGLVVEGSTLDVSLSAVRDTRRGVVAEWRPTGHVPGELSLVQSTVEGSREVGVEVWNAAAKLDRVTVRGSGSDCPPDDAARPPGSYAGNGIRARYDRVGAPTEERTLGVTATLVDGARQAGVHVEGGSLTLDHALVRGTEKEACTDEFGDGVVEYAYDFSPGDGRIEATRISKNAGAGVVSFGASLALAGAELDCNRSGIVSAGGEVNVETAACGCGSSWRSCGVTRDDDRVRSVVTADCTTGRSVDCWRVCFEEFGTPGKVLEGATERAFGERRVAPAVTDNEGCCALGGLTAGREGYVLGTLDGYVPDFGPIGAADAPPATPAARIPFDTEGFIGAAEIIPDFRVSKLDLATAPVVAVWACERPAPGGAPPLAIDAACPSGIAGLTVSLDPAGGPEATVPFYSDPSLFPSPMRTSAAGGAMFWLNVSPGEYTVTLTPPPGYSGLDCSDDFFGPGYQPALPAGGSSYRFRVLPGFVTGAAWLYCAAVP